MSFSPQVARGRAVIPHGGGRATLNWLWVAGGGAIGSALRYGLVLGVHRWLGGGWFFGTLAVNLIGSFAIGWASRLFLSGEFLGAGGRLFLIVGLLGGFTTFSAFSLETLQLLQEGSWRLAALYVALSVAGCLLAVWAGFHLAA